MSNQVSLARDMLKLTVLTSRPLTLLGRQGCGRLARLKFLLRRFSPKRLCLRVLFYCFIVNKRWTCTHK